MANPILHPRHAMWASAGLLTGCGLTLIATHLLHDDHSSHQLAPARHVTRVASSEMTSHNVEVVRPLTHASRCSEPGKIKGRSTSDRCCWYGQRWSGKLERCIGTPFRCPEGHIALGETCAALEPALSSLEVESALDSVQPMLHDCAYVAERAYHEPIWLDLSISSRGQAFAITPSAGQSALRSDHGRAVLRCVQDRLIQTKFPAGHRTTRVHHLVINAHITPELQ